MMRRFFSTTLGQILAIVAGSSAITFVLFLVLLSTLYPDVMPPPPWPWPAAYRTASVIDALRALPEERRASYAATVQVPDAAIRLAAAPAACDGLGPDARELQSALHALMPDGADALSVRSCDAASSRQNVQIVAKLGGQSVEIRTGRSAQGHFSMLTFPFVGALLFLTVGVASLSAWSASRVIGPLERLSERADAFGRDTAVAPIKEEGPSEIRRAARAFNHLQERISRSIRDRTRMLAAVSHDLRTPLTRMRLLLDTQQVDQAHDKLYRDVTLMQSMVASALAYLSGGLGEEEREWLDLGALLATLCDESEEAGAAIRYEGPEQIQLLCRPNAINRAMTNLIENGIHFGRDVVVAASWDRERVTVDVIDDGPGIPADRLQDVVEPFVRLEPSRSGGTGGVGLGLSIVKEIVEAHGGTLELINRQPAGLIARVVLPAPPSQHTV